MGFTVFFIYIILCFMVASAGSNRKIGGGAAFFLSLIFSPLIGIIFTALSDKKDPSEEQKYKAHYEAAQMEEFKGNIHKAIDEYKNALYYLRDNGQPLSPIQVKQREEKFEEIKMKMEALGGSLTI